MGLSGPQILIIILVVAILFLGPSRIPQLGKSLGQAIRGFKKGITSDEELDVTDSVTQEKIDESDATDQTTSSATDKNKV